MSEPAAQPLLASAIRAVRTLEDLSDPLPAEVTSRLSTVERSDELEELLRPFVLIDARIDEHGLTMSAPGEAPPRLVQHGWRSFLVRVANPYRLSNVCSLRSHSNQHTSAPKDRFKPIRLNPRGPRRGLVDTSYAWSASGIGIGRMKSAYIASG